MCQSESLGCVNSFHFYRWVNKTKEDRIKTKSCRTATIKFCWAAVRWCEKYLGSVDDWSARGNTVLIRCKNINSPKPIFYSFDLLQSPSAGRPVSNSPSLNTSKKNQNKESMTDEITLRFVHFILNWFHSINHTITIDGPVLPNVVRVYSCLPDF